MLRISEFKEILLVHSLQPAGPLPTILDSEGIYPYQSFVETSERPKLKEYQMVAIENSYIRIKFCPDLGGKVYSIVEKKSGKEVLYDPGAVRPVRILPRMAFISGGIEVSFPISHTPVQIEKVNYDWKQIGDRIYLWCGEKELSTGMQWTVEFSLGERDTFLTQRTMFYNGTTQNHSWMSWSNAAVPAHEDSELHFPEGEVLLHSDQLFSFRWEDEKHGLLKQHDRMSGYFWTKPEYYAFGVFTPSIGSGLYHIADSEQVPGIKLWTYGIGPDEKWAHASSIDKSSYIEIQAGPIVDQSITEELSPGQRHIHTEFWIPSTSSLSIKEISLPKVQLIKEDVIPLFDWVERIQTKPWMELIKAYNQKIHDSFTCHPPLESNYWPPSGMDLLGDALEWLIDITNNSENEYWKYYLGVWQAGRGQFDDALELLKGNSLDWARLLEARILIYEKKYYKQAASALSRIKSVSLSIHPQVIIERDIALSFLGDETLAEREFWLKKVASLSDDGLIERKAVWLYDSGHYEEASKLLESTSFSLVHQRYERSNLWCELQKKLGKNFDRVVPDSLGEDNLAPFGQYRVYENNR